MKRKTRNLDGTWKYYDKKTPKQFIFPHPTCTDKSKFVPEMSDNGQYNGNASGNNPQYDFQDGKMPKGFHSHQLRKPGLDITEIDEFIKGMKSKVKDDLKDIEKTTDEIKNALGTDATVSEV